jgi:hypothetical protein
MERRTGIRKQKNSFFTRQTRSPEKRNSQQKVGMFLSFFLAANFSADISVAEFLFPLFVARKKIALWKTGVDVTWLRGRR